MQVKFRKNMGNLTEQFCIKMSLNIVERHFYAICPRAAYRHSFIMARKAERLRRIMSLDTQ